MSSSMKLTNQIRSKTTDFSKSSKMSCFFFVLQLHNFHVSIDNLKCGGLTSYEAVAKFTILQNFHAFLNIVYCIRTSLTKKLEITSLVFSLSSYGIKNKGRFKKYPSYCPKITSSPNNEFLITFPV